MPAPSDRSGLYEGSRYRMQQRKSTLAGTGGRSRCSPRCCRPASVSLQLIDPGGELVPIEPQVFPEFDVRDAVGASALVQPAHRHPEEVRGLLDCQPRHDRAPGDSAFPPRRMAHGRRSSYTSDDEAPRGQDDCHFERARRIDRSAVQTRVESGNHDSSRSKGMPAVNQASPRSAQSTARLLQSATLVFSGASGSPAASSRRTFHGPLVSRGREPLGLPPRRPRRALRRVAVRALAPSRADRQVLGSEASPRYPAESKAVRLSLAIVVQVSNRLSVRPPIQGSRGAHKSESR